MRARNKHSPYTPPESNWADEKREYERESLLKDNSPETAHTKATKNNSMNNNKVPQKNHATFETI
jgi:hypothetical protein